MTLIDNGTLDMDSILLTVKKQLGLRYDDDDFDSDVIIAINSALSDLHQIGIGPDEGFEVRDSNQTWSDLIPSPLVNNVRRYIFYKVRLMVDPPQNSFVITAMNDQLAETVWRIAVYVDSTKEDNNGESGI